MIMIIIIIIIIIIITIKSLLSYFFTVLINKLRRLKIYLLKGEKSLSVEMELFSRIPSRCSSEE